LEYTYVRAARTISNRKQFAGTFLLIAFTTMLIISIVKTSLALSLGLVGALSIVRFRAAIKEPEELSYIFFAIALGLGLGANQTIVVIEAFAIAMVIIWVRYFISGKSTRQNLYLNISAKAGEVELKQVIDIVKREFGKFHLKRYDESNQIIEASFMVDSPKPEKLQSLTESLSKLGSDTRVSFVESKSF
jgi:predicted membrane protein